MLKIFLEPLFSKWHEDWAIERASVLITNNILHFWQNSAEDIKFVLSLAWEKSWPYLFLCLKKRI